MLSHVLHVGTLWTSAHQAPLSSTVSRSLLRLMSIESVMLSNHLILSYSLPLSPSTFLAPGSFLAGRLFISGSQSIGTSALASVFPINIQGLFPLQLTGLIFLQSKELSRVFSSTTSQSINSSALRILYEFSHPDMTTGKNHSFDYMDS